MIDLGKHCVLGVPIRAVDYEAAVTTILGAARQHQPLGVSAMAVHGVMTGALDRYHRYRLNHLDLLVPDGQPVRWALRWLHGIRLPDRVYGPNLMLKVCEAAAIGKVPIFLYGSTSDTLDALHKNLVTRYPDLVIAGIMPSKFRALSADEQQEVAARIRDSGAKIVFVGLGCPRQEVWAYEMHEMLPMPVLAVGAAFAFHAGKLAQAPSRLQNAGLEWLFRLLKEPTRLWRRYLLLNPLYLMLVFLQWTRLYTLDEGTCPGPEQWKRYG